jgi:hypothetical protein
MMMGLALTPCLILGLALTPCLTVTIREIEEECHPDDDVRIRGNLVYTMPEVSAESRRREHRRNERINYFPEN